MIVTDKQAFAFMIPKQGETVNPYQVVAYSDDSIVEWANPDEQFTVKFDPKTRELTGSYYDWDEDKEDWVDGEPMCESDIRLRLSCREFLLMEY